MEEDRDMMNSCSGFTHSCFVHRERFLCSLFIAEMRANIKVDLDVTSILRRRCVSIQSRRKHFSFPFVLSFAVSRQVSWTIQDDSFFDRPGRRTVQATDSRQHASGQGGCVGFGA